jgi:hypothetical protein
VYLTRRLMRGTASCITGIPLLLFLSFSDYTMNNLG